MIYALFLLWCAVSGFAWGIFGPKLVNENGFIWGAGLLGLVCFNCYLGSLL